MQVAGYNGQEQRTFDGTRYHLVHSNGLAGGRENGVVRATLLASGIQSLHSQS